MDYTEVKESDAPRKVLFVTGAPACGKGTQGDKIIHKYKYDNFSLGDIFRAETKKGEALGQKLQEYMSAGNLVPEDLVIDALSNGIQERGGRQIVDGFPRSLNQALVYEHKLGELYLILYFEVQKDVLLERMERRKNETPVHLRRADDDPKIFEVRLNNFLSESMKVIDFYNKLGKVRLVDAMPTPDEVFKATVEALTPNVICITGPPCIGKTTLANRLKDHMYYGYIDFQKFCRLRNLTTCEQKMKTLMSFLDRMPQRNFVLDGFPQTQKQAKIYFETFGSPVKLFYVEAEKDEVFNRIYNHSQSTNDSVSQDSIKSEFDDFLQHKDSLYNFIKDKKFFQAINGHLEEDEIFNICRTALSPVVHFCNKNENVELANQYIRKLEKKGFVYLNITKIVEAEKSRGLPIGEALKEWANYGNICALLRKVVYSEPLQNKKFLISNFPNDLDFLKVFKHEVCEFNLMLHFNKSEGAQYDPEFTEVVGSLHSLNRLVGVGVNDPTIVDFHSEKKNRYGIFVGATGTGKTTIAKHLGKTGQAEVINFEKYREKVVAPRLTKEDVTPAPEDVTMQQVLTELHKDMSAARPDQFYVLDGFNWGDGNFELLIKICGDPLFVLRLGVDKELLISKYQKKKEISELSDEDNDIIVKDLAAFNDLSGKISELVNNNSNLAIYDIDITQPVSKTLEAVSNIFKKRVFVVRITSTDIDTDKLKHIIAWLCASYDYQFIDIESVMAEATKKNPYGLKDSQAILNIIKYRVNSNKRMCRNVLLFNCLQADQDSGEAGFYPNSKDEVFYIEQNIGKIRTLFNFSNSEEPLGLSYQLILKPEKPEPVKKKNADGDDQDEPPIDEEAEEEKKKFKPENYDWYDVSDRNMSLPQLFVNMHPTTVETGLYNDENSENLVNGFRNIHERFEEGADVYIYLGLTTSLISAEY